VPAAVRAAVRAAPADRPFTPCHLLAPAQVVYTSPPVSMDRLAANPQLLPGIVRVLSDSASSQGAAAPGAAATQSAAAAPARPVDVAVSWLLSKPLAAVKALAAFMVRAKDPDATLGRVGNKRLIYTWVTTAFRELLTGAARTHLYLSVREK
jgi:hypothetical protein